MADVTKSPSSKRDTILVVDDEQRIIDLARMYLEQDGFRVTSTTNGTAAKRMILTRTNRTWSFWI